MCWVPRTQTLQERFQCCRCIGLILGNTPGRVGKTVWGGGKGEEMWCSCNKGLGWRHRELWGWDGLFELFLSGTWESVPLHWTSTSTGSWAAAREGPNFSWGSSLELSSVSGERLAECHQHQTLLAAGEWGPQSWKRIYVDMLESPTPALPLTCCLGFGQLSNFSRTHESSSIKWGWESLEIELET